MSTKPIHQISGQREYSLCYTGHSKETKLISNRCLHWINSRWNFISLTICLKSAQTFRPKIFIWIFASLITMLWSKHLQILHQALVQVINSDTTLCPKNVETLCLKPSRGSSVYIKVHTICGLHGVAVHTLASMAVKFGAMCLTSFPGSRNWWLNFKIRRNFKFVLQIVMLTKSV